MDIKHQLAICAYILLHLVCTCYGRPEIGFDYATTQYNTSRETSSVCAIIDTCYTYLEEHLMLGRKWGLDFHYYRPALQKYGPHQWLWDSGSHMIVWAHRNVTNAILDLKTMLQMQQPDGRIPEIIFWGPQVRNSLPI
jgi:hypothetical protein